MAPFPVMEKLETAPVGGLMRRPFHENVASPLVVPLDLGGRELVANSMVLPISTDSGTTFTLRACLYRLASGSTGRQNNPVQGAGDRILTKIHGTEMQTGGTSVNSTAHLQRVFAQIVHLVPTSMYYLGIAFSVSAGALNFYMSDSSDGAWMDLNLPVARTLPLEAGVTATTELPESGPILTRNGRTDFAPYAVLYSRRGAYLFGNPFLHP